MEMTQTSVAVLPDPTAAPPAAETGEVYILPTSFAQRRLWLLHQLDPRSVAYNVSGGFRLRGRLDADALRRSLGEVVRRHEVLRTTFLLQDDEPVQVVATAGSAPLPCVDLAALPAAQREARRQEVLESVASRPFDLRRGPLLRCVLLRLAEGEHAFLYALHHIVTDGWSEAIFVRELAALYHDFAAGRPPSLPELPIQYGDFAQWQRDWLQGEVLDRLLAYWQGRLAGAPTVLDLPCDHPRPAVFSYRGSAVPFTVPAEVQASLRRLQEQERVTLFSLLLAAYGVLLDRHTGQPDLLIGSPVANRNAPELEELIGLFLDTLVLRLDLSANPTFRELLAQAQEMVLGAHEHQDLVFERLLVALGVARDPSRNPLFQVALTLQNTPPIEAEVAGLEISPLPLAAVSAKFDLQLTVQESGGALLGAFEYATDLFDEATVRRLADRFVVLLAEIARTPDGRVRELPLLSAAERGELRSLAGAAAPGPVFCLHERFAARAAQSPRSVAVVCEGEALTYAELDDRSDRLAVCLQGLGVGPEVPVAIHMERSPELVVAILGVLKAGSAYLPIDPSYPPERIAFLLADAAAPVLLTRSAEAGTLPEGAVAARVLRLDADAAEIFGSSGRPAGEVSPGHAAYIIYTSGSTGRPKGVVVSHANVARLLDATRDRFGFGADDVWTLFHSHAFDFSVWEIWGALLHGGRLVVVPYLTSRSPELFAELLEREGVTVLNQTPSAFRNLLSVAAGPASPPLARLRWVIFGGEALEPRALAPWWGRHAEGRPHLVNMYGITETTVHVTERELGRADLEAGSVIGRPLPHLEIHLLNPALVPLPPGVAGEIHVGGAGLARGYLGRPALTAERFIPDPFAGAPGARLYRSGDLARWLPDGELEYLGRIDDQVKIRGFRIELGEIEAALLRHPGVRDAVVAVREDAPGEQRLVAYLVTSTAAAPAAAELRAHLEATLPAPMIPAAFCCLERLPLTPHGKIDRRALPAPGPAELDPGNEFVAPRSREEEAVAAAWSAALGIGRVGAHDSFFALGGDSIRTLKAVALLRERGFDTSVQQIFLHPVVADLARSLRGGRGPGDDSPTAPFSLVPAADRARLPEGLEDAYPLSGLQGGMLFHMQESTESLRFHNLNSHHLRLPFDPEAFERAVLHIVARHPVLRTSFDLTSYGEPLQLVHREPRSPFRWDDLRASGPDVQEETIAAYWREQLATPFDLASYPQIRFHLHWRGDDSCQFTLTENHAVLDGWSLHTLYSEILTCYFALLRGEPLPELPPLGSTFRDFIHLERQALASEETQDFWRRKLDGCRVLKVPRLATGAGRREPGGASRVQRSVIPLPAASAAGLRELARQETLSLKNVLLAAHVKVMGLLAGETDVLTSFSSNGRPERLDGSRICGLFLNTLPLRLELSGGSWRELARQVQAAEREILPHRRYSLAAIQKSHGREALLETSFVYLSFHVMDDVVRAQRMESLGSGLFVEETNFPVMASFQGASGSGEIAFHLDCDREVLSEPQVRALEGYYLRVLAAMAASPDARYETFSPLSEAERHQLLVEHNDAARAHRLERPVHELFAEHAARTPDLPCVTCEERTLTYRELDRQAARLAQRLARAGIGSGDRVPICLPRSVEMIVGILGVLKAGGAFVPLDGSQPVERLRLLVEDSGASLVLTTRSWVERLAPCGRDLLCVDAEEEAAGSCDEAAPRAGSLPAALAYVIYTSGSTGKPKGVAVGHRQLASYLGSILDLLSPSPGASFALVSTFAADLGLTLIFGALTTGGCLHVIAEERTKDSGALAELFARRPIDCLKIVPSHLVALLEHSEPEQILPRRWLILGGEALDWHLARRLRALAPSCRIFNEYGPTETTVAVLSEELGVHPEDAAASASVPVGRPMSNARADVVGPDLQLVPLAVAGELLIGGPNVAFGYLGEPGLTAEKFIPDPFGREEGVRLYRSGDLCRRLPDGRIEFLGRIDRQVKIRGFRVELGEIEAVLRDHASVRDVVVVVREEEEGGAAVVAYVVPRREASEEDLRRAIAERLPSYMMPAAFVLLEKLPLTPNGKIDRRALPAPQSESRDLKRRLAGPINELEVQLLHLWEEILGQGRIGVTEDFFSLGGTSLQAVRLVARIRKDLGQRILLSTLIDHRTIRDLAGLLRQEMPAPEHLVPIQPRGANPPLYFIHPGSGNVVCYLELARFLGPEQPFFGVQSLDLDHDNDPYVSIEEMASRYVPLLRAARPSGPFLLGGWSFGGMVAFEIAQQLRRLGERVGGVFLLDTSVPVITGSLGQISPELMRANLVIDHASGAALTAGKEALSLTPYDIVHLELEEQLELMLDELAQRDAMPLDVDREMLRRYFHMRLARIEAMNQYVPQPYDGKVVLFRTSLLNTEIPLVELQHIYQEAMLRHPSYGWSEIARGVEIEPVPGHHESMIREPHVRVLAAAVERHVALVEREPGRENDPLYRLEE